MSREAFDVEAALEKCHKGTAWQRGLIREQLIAARAAALEKAAEVCMDLANVRLKSERTASYCNQRAAQCAQAIRALKEKP